MWQTLMQRKIHHSIYNLLFTTTATGNMKKVFGCSKEFKPKQRILKKRRLRRKHLFNQAYTPRPRVFSRSLVLWIRRRARYFMYLSASHHYLTSHLHFNVSHTRAYSFFFLGNGLLMAKDFAVPCFLITLSTTFAAHE